MCYRALVKAVIGAMDADRVAWRMFAYDTADEEAIAVDKLDDPETLWGIFGELTMANRNLDRAKFDAMMKSK